MIFARSLDGAFDGLRARIGEKHVIGEARSDETLGEALRLGDLKQIGRMPQFGALFIESRNEMRMTVAKRGDGNAAAKVKKALAGRRGQPSSLSPFEGEIDAGIGRKQRRRHFFHSKRFAAPGRASAGPRPAMHRIRTTAAQESRERPILLPAQKTELVPERLMVRPGPGPASWLQDACALLRHAFAIPPAAFSAALRGPSDRSAAHRRPARIPPPGCRTLLHCLPGS